MTENHSEPFVPDEAPADEPGPAAEAVTDEPVVRTGHEAVDRVLDSLDALAGTPVADHVTVFEEAHDRLRGTLAGAGDTPPQS